MAIAKRGKPLLRRTIAFAADSKSWQHLALCRAWLFDEDFAGEVREQVLGVNGVLVDLLRDAERVIDLDAQVANCAFELRMTLCRSRSSRYSG